MTRIRLEDLELAGIKHLNELVYTLGLSGSKTLVMDLDFENGIGYVRDTKLRDDLLFDVDMSRKELNQLWHIVQTVSNRGN